MAEEWQDLLDMDAAKAVRPPAKPKGTYRALVSGWKHIKSPNKGTDGVEFTLTALEPMADVDAEKWTAYLNHPAIQGSKVEETETFWMSRKAMWRLRNFCEVCGAKPEGTLLKMVSDSINSAVLVSIDQQATSDGEGEYNVIKGFSRDKQ